MFFAVRSDDSFNFPLGWIKYIVIVIAIMYVAIIIIVHMVSIVIMYTVIPCYHYVDSHY